MIDPELEYQACLLAALDYIRMAADQIRLAQGVADKLANLKKITPGLSLAEIELQAEIRRVQGTGVDSAGAEIPANQAALIDAVLEVGE